MDSPSNETSYVRTWRGASITDICKGKGHWSFAVTPITPSKYHHVLYEMPATLQTPPKPHNSSQTYHWDDEHVRMPYSDRNLFPVNEHGTDVIKCRWKIIGEALSKPILSSHEFETALNKYNSSLPAFGALHYFFNEFLENDESKQIFSNLLPKIIKLALTLPETVPSGIPLLQQNRNRSLSMSQAQIACLLANAFLCTFPWKKKMAGSYPGINFVGLFAASLRPSRQNCVCEKLKCIFNYFRRITKNSPVGVLTFERKFIPRSAMPRWDKNDNNLGNIRAHISSTGTIEDDGLGFLQVDFANKNIGGGVLRYGCVQEEIRFVICPELIVSRLFVEKLGNGEAVIITGAERYNHYSGYGDTFEWENDCEDDTPFDVYGRRRTSICVIDATRFDNPSEQYQSSSILRELNKAYVGFSSREKDNLAPVATGNWGCGAFQGSKQLKTLIQLMACTVAGRDVVYYSFGDEELRDNFYQIYLFLANNKVTVSQLWRFLCQFSAARLDEQELYSFIEKAYFDSKKQPTISKFFTKANDKAEDKRSPYIAPSSSTETLLTTRPSQKPPTSPKKTDDSMDTIDESSSSSEDVVPPTPPDPKAFKKIVVLKPKRTPDEIASKLPQTDIGEIMDVLDGNANRSKIDTKSQQGSRPFPSVFGEFQSQKNNEPSEEGAFVKDEQMDVHETGRKMSKKKITDYFAKLDK